MQITFEGMNVFFPLQEALVEVLAKPEKKHCPSQILLLSLKLDGKSDDSFWQCCAAWPESYNLDVR